MTTTNLSTRTILATGQTRHGDRLDLLYRTDGLTIGGADMVPVQEAWGAIFTEHTGVTGGQWFASLAAATERFNLWNAAKAGR